VKKTIAFLVACVLCLTTFAFSASAAVSPDTYAGSPQNIISVGSIYKGRSFLHVSDKYQAATYISLGEKYEPIFNPPVPFIKYQARLFNSKGELQLASTPIVSITDRCPTATTGFWEGDGAFSRGWTWLKDFDGNITEHPLPGTQMVYMGRSADEGNRILKSFETTLDNNHQYQVNQFGESYGLAVLVDIVGEEPDLIAAVGINGTDGYVRAEELSDYYDVSSDEVVFIPLYDVDGNEIDTFALNSMKEG